MVEKVREHLDRIFIRENNDNLILIYSGLMKYIPLIICGGFFVFTILLFAFGPIDWDVTNPAKLYSFLIACVIALCSGYILAVKKGKTASKRTKLNVNNILIICSTVFLIMYIPTLITTTGKWYPDVVTGIFDTGGAYRISKYYNEHGSQLALYIRMLLSPFMIMVMPITLFFMPKLSKSGKAIGILVIILTVFMSIAQGVNKSVADFTAQMVLFLIMILFSNVNHKSKIKFRLKMALLIVLICVSFFAYYANGMKNRLSTDIAMSKLGTNSYSLNLKKKIQQ